MDCLKIICHFGILFIYCGAQTPRPSPSYLISSPQVLRPKIPTSLSVTVLAQYPLRVTSEIVNGNTSVVSVEGLFQGGSTGLLVLPPDNNITNEIPDSAIHYSSPYTLVVMGYVRERLVFTNSSVLRFSPKSCSTFIQTDKSTYKPGQVVKIRTVSIFPDGKPCKSKVDIVIKDPKRNTIFQWMTLDSFLGVVSREFLLSDNPPLGEWAIEATVDGVLSEKTFTVDNYVLPKFDIQIQAPTAIYYTDDLTGTVRSHYTFGKPVKGLLTVTAQFQIYAKPMSASKTMEIDGSAHFIFNQNDLYEYSKHNERDEVIYLTANVTTFTGLTYNTTIEVNVIRNKYQLTFLESSSALRPSLNFSTYLKVRSYSKTLTAETVTVTVTQLKSSPWSWRQDEWNSLWPQGRNGSESLENLPGRGPLGEDDAQLMTMTFPVPADGVIPIQVLVSDYVATLTIKATLGDSKATLQMYSSYSSPTSSYIQISRDHSPIQVGVPFPLVVQSNFPLREFHYLLVCRGQVVAAGKGSHSFTLTPDESWAPHASVIVYTVLTNGEVVNNMMVIPFAQVLRNNVSLSWSQASVKPGAKVTLGVSVMEPKSLVGILVVDKAAKLLKQDNDITLEAVLEELTEYDTDKKVSSPWREIMRNDPYSIFEACNLMVLTDATLSKVKAQEHVPMFPGEGIQELFQAEEVVASEPRVRKLFPETWLWLDANMSDSTTASYSVTVPDSITSWIATGFVMSENRGLGLVSLPQKLTVFKNVFLALKLPRLIVRGESIVLEAIVFNYLPHELEVMVIVAESEAFDFVPDNDLAMASTQRVYVRSEDSATVLFPLRPKMLGEIPISVKAISIVSSDAIIKNILIKPEGIERTFSKSIFLEVDSAEHHLMRVINFTFPPDVVQGSQRAEVAAVGDILGPSITGLESLIQMPYGCGEQNMINFAPNVYVLEYLVKAGQVTEKIRSKSISFMTQGYQRELSYQRIDGSFSAFGNSDTSGSTWLSAFVLRCFLQARPYIYIDPGVLSRTAAWLVNQQRPDGAFLEPGRVIHTELQGGLDGPVALTAYVLQALLEDPAYMIEYQKNLNKALAFLEGKLDSGISSNYSLCLVAYALSLTNHSSANKALMELFDRAVIQDNVMPWSSSSSRLLKTRRPRSSDIEMAAYVLLSVFKLGMLDKGFPLLKWLIVQRNHLGGFGSTQDTIIALQALSWYAGVGNSSAIDLSIKIVQKPSLMGAHFHIDSTNYLLRQSQEIDAERDINIEVFAEGQGFALLQLNVFYNLESGGLAWRHQHTEEEDAFYLTVEVITDGSLDHLTIRVCTRLSESEGIDQTGMAIMEVGLLSGFVLAQKGVETNNITKKVEEDQERVQIYLDSVTLMPLCVEIRIIRDFKVAKVQDAVVVVYDYYEPSRRAEKTYNLKALQNTSPCDFCGYDCHQCKGLTYVSASPSLSHSAAWIPAALLLLFLA